MVKASYRMLWLITACCNPYLPPLPAVHRLYGAVLALDDLRADNYTDYKILFRFWHAQYTRLIDKGNNFTINLDNVPMRLHMQEVEDNEAED